MGVLDLGIGALAILTEIVPETLIVTAAELSVPCGHEAPVAATLYLSGNSGLAVTATFDRRGRHDRHQEIDVKSAIGHVALSNGGKVLTMDGRILADGPVHEYRDIYGRFLDLVQRGGSDADTAPLAHVADAVPRPTHPRGTLGALTARH